MRPCQLRGLTFKLSQLSRCRELLFIIDFVQEFVLKVRSFFGSFSGSLGSIPFPVFAVELSSPSVSSSG